MSDFETAVMCVSALAAVAIVAIAWLWVRKDASSAELARQNEARAAAREARDAERERAAADAVSAAERGARDDAGPQDGALLGVHVGAQVIRGTRVLRGSADADGWLVLEDASLLEGRSETPLGGRQWLAGSSWVQELDRK